VSVVANVAINVDSSGAVSKLRQVQQGAQATSQAVDKLNATTAATSDKFKIAANGIKYFTDAAGRARAENGRFVTTAERAAAGLEAQGRAAQQASGKFNGLRNALASLGAGLAVRKAFVDASELESAQARIGLLTKNFSQLTGIQEVAANAAKKFNLSQSESLGALTDLGNRIGPTGASLQDVANVYEGFNTLLALNKVNSQNAASATLQLNQALGSGRLAGEEFNAISEATPQLLDAVAKVLGRNRGELKQLASDGKISSQVLIDALTRIRTEGAADLETAFGGAFGATRRFNAALEDFSATVGTELLPALTPLINKATEILKLFGELPGPVKTTAVAILGLTAAFVVLAPAVAAVSLAAAPWLALAAGIAAAGLAILDAANAQRDFNNVIATAPLPDVNAKIQELESKLRAAETKLADVTAQFGPLSREAAFAQASVDGLKGSLDLAKGDYKIRLLFESVGVKPDARFFGPGFAAPAAPTRATPTPTTGTGTGKGAKKGSDDAKRAAEQMQQQLKAADDINFALKNRLTIAQVTEPVAKRMLEYDVKQNEIAKEYDELKKVAKSADELALINANLVIEQRIAQVEYEREINELLIERATLVANLVKASSMPTVYNELEEQDAALQAILDKYPAIGSAADAAATLATSGIAAMIDGTKSAEQVFVEFLSSIADALIDTAKQMIAQYIAIGIARMFAGIGAPGGFAPSGPLAAVGNVNTDVSGFFAPSANGNAFGANGIIPFAKGGIVNSPTLFPFAKGIGLMGEAGPEAILPLSRGPGGKLGVMASGGGGDVNVVVNVDAKGSSVEGDQLQAKALGNAISAAVQSELVKQKRPGGLLA
jgi:tape measure domain-containing protein